MIRHQDMEHTSIQMELSILGFGRMMFSMEMEWKDGWMGQCLRESIGMEKRMGKEGTSGWTSQCMMGTGIIMK
jgi:hypothetical protein